MSLNTVQEIEHAIRALTPSELEELYSWEKRGEKVSGEKRCQEDVRKLNLDLLSTM